MLAALAQPAAEAAQVLERQNGSRRFVAQGEAGVGFDAPTLCPPRRLRARREKMAGPAIRSLKRCTSLQAIVQIPTPFLDARDAWDGRIVSDESPQPRVRLLVIRSGHVSAH
jgi:hypothetical protein